MCILCSCWNRCLFKYTSCLQLNDLATEDTAGAESASSESSIATSDRGTEDVSPGALLEAFARPPPTEDEEFKQYIWHAIGTLLRGQQPAALGSQDNDIQAFELNSACVKRQLALHILPFRPKYPVKKASAIS